MLDRFEPPASVVVETIGLSGYNQKLVTLDGCSGHLGFAMK